MIDVLSRGSRRRRGVAAALVAVLLAASASAQTGPMEVRTRDEVAVPGGVLQLKLEVTEPRPIFTGGGDWAFQDYGDFLGIAVGGEAGDAAAAGVLRGTTLKVRMVSPSNTLAQTDYPILTATVGVPGSAPPGRQTIVDVAIDRFTGPGGAVIPTVGQPGTVIVAGGAWISDVVPGNGTVAAGGVITIHGGGFLPGETAVTLKETALTSVTVVNDSLIQVVPAQPVTMFGREVHVEVGTGGDRQRLDYYAYPRTQTLLQSGDPLFGAVEVAFPETTWQAAAVSIAAPASAHAPGLALQNASAASSTVTVRLVNGTAPAAPLTFELPAYARVAASLAEIFGTSCTAACTVRVHATAPVQVLGLDGDRAADVVDPILPVLDTQGPPVLALTTSVTAATVRAGDPFAVAAAFSPGDTPVVVDAYVVLLTPAGEYWSLTPTGLVSGLLPYIEQTAVVGAFSRELLRLPLPPGTPPGRYTWLSALALPGTLNLVTPIRTTSFDVMP
ncbi:MAG: hypothetical protein R2708_18500 [Vicinamibacterales bacterium]